MPTRLQNCPAAVFFQGLIAIIFMFWCNGELLSQVMEIFGPFPHLYSSLLLLRHESFGFLCVEIEASHSRDLLDVAVILYCLTRTETYKFSCLCTLERSLPSEIITRLSVHYFTMCSGERNTLVLNMLNHKYFDQCVFVKIVSILQGDYTSTQFEVITSYLMSIKSKLTLANRAVIASIASKEKDRYTKEKFLIILQ